jgi:hypothetical protein
MEKLAQAGGGGCTPHPFPISPIKHKVVVYAPDGRADKLPYFYSTPIRTLWPADKRTHRPIEMETHLRSPKMKKWTARALKDLNGFSWDTRALQRFWKSIACTQLSEERKKEKCERALEQYGKYHFAHKKIGNKKLSSVVMIFMINYLLIDVRIYN